MKRNQSCISWLSDCPTDIAADSIVEGSAVPPTELYTKNWGQTPFYESYRQTVRWQRGGRRE
jgi:hypothetical protein